MRVALCHHEFEKAKRAEDVSSERFSTFASNLTKFDFGQLAHRIRTQFKLPDDPWIQIFKDAKQLRNYAMHEFWSPNYGLLRSEKGVRTIVRHCEVLERHFDHLGDGIVHVTGADPQMFVELMSDPKAVNEAIAGYDHLLAEAEKVAKGLPGWTD
jgi:hypothetical protein